MLAPMKIVLSPYKEHLPERRNSRRRNKKPSPEQAPPHHLQVEIPGEKIDLTA